MHSTPPIESNHYGEIVFRDPVTSIGDEAFTDCSSLTSVTLPDSVTSIGDGAFYCCSNLVTVICKNITPPTLSTAVFYGCDKLSIVVPQSYVETYKSAGGWSTYSDRIIDVDTYKKNLLAEIETAMNKVDNLTSGDLVAINGYKEDIEESTNMNAVTAAKDAALLFISKRAALIAISAAMEEENGSAYLNNLVADEVAAINNATEFATIETTRDSAVAKLSNVLAAYKASKTEAFGTMGTRQVGPAVKITDQNGKEIILYNPQNVDFINVTK